jgi:hypothetical protein
MAPGQANFCELCDRGQRVGSIDVPEVGPTQCGVGEISLDEISPRPRRRSCASRALASPALRKILLFDRSHAVLGLDSNGVRVLTRLGVAQEAKTYAATYRAVQAAVSLYAGEGFDWLIRAHQLLRQHGQDLCRRNQPGCDRCPLSDSCAFFAAR